MIVGQGEEMIQKVTSIKFLFSSLCHPPHPSFLLTHTHTISSSSKSVLVTGWLPVISNNVCLVVHRCEHTRCWLWCDSKSTRCSKYNFPSPLPDFCGPTCAIHFQPYEAGDLTRVSQQAHETKARRLRKLAEASAAFTVLRLKSGCGSD